MESKVPDENRSSAVERRSPNVPFSSGPADAPTAVQPAQQPQRLVSKNRPAPMGPPSPLSHVDARDRVDAKDVQRTIALFYKPDEVFEVRLLDAVPGSGWNKPRTFVGYFRGSDADVVVRQLKAFRAWGGVYVTLNPLNIAIYARSAARTQESKTAATDADVVQRRRILIDFDPVRISGVSSSDVEHDAAIECAHQVRKNLVEQKGWPEPLIASSGNGAHLIFSVCLPNESDLVERVLRALDSAFSDAQVSIDTSVHNPARITKLYGTLACKGDSIPERQHRMARIIDAPATLDDVPLEKLEELARSGDPAASTNARAPKTGTPAQPAPVKMDAEDAEKLIAPDLEELARVVHALDAIPPDDRETWLHVGMALHSTRWYLARAIWDEWSQRCLAKYHDHDQDKTWSSFKRKVDGGVKLGTLFHMARQRNWDPSTPASQQAHDLVASLPVRVAASSNWPHIKAAPAQPAPPPPSQRSPKHTRRGQVDRKPGQAPPKPGTPVGNTASNAVLSPPPQPHPAAPGSGPTKTASLHRTDLGNAERLVAHHGGDILYCRGVWFVWDQRRYRQDELGKVELMAKRVVRLIFAEAASFKKADDREEHAKFGLASERDARVKAMLERARVEDPFARASNELDSDPWLFNAINGTVDLRTGNLQAHRRENLITKLAPAKCDPDAHCEDWDRFLDQALDGDSDLIAWLQRFTGYSLTGDISEDRVPILYGPGGTGKSTALETLKRMFGDYARTISWETLLKNKHGGGGGARDEIARLAGARLVIASEVEPDREFNAGLLKSLSGDDTIAARFLYKGTFEFKPTFKLMIAANDLPAVRSSDSGAWRRIVVVPFKRRPSKPDKGLRERLRTPEARAGVLAWALRGLAEWREHGLGTATAIERHTEQYRDRESLIDRFISECCQVHLDASAPARDLYDAFTAFAARIAPEREPMGDTRFGRELGDRGHQPVSGCWNGAKGKGRAGLRLRAP